MEAGIQPLIEFNHLINLIHEKVIYAALVMAAYTSTAYTQTIPMFIMNSPAQWKSRLVILFTSGGDISPASQG